MVQKATLEERIEQAQEQTKQTTIDTIPFIHLNEGVNIVEFLPEDPFLGKYGWNYTVRINDVKGILCLKGRLEQQVLKALKNSPNRTVTILRSGQGLATRYVVQG